MKKAVRYKRTDITNGTGFLRSQQWVAAEAYDALVRRGRAVLRSIGHDLGKNQPEEWHQLAELIRDELLPRGALAMSPDPEATS